MKLKDLLENVPYEILQGSICIDVGSITADSRKVKLGTLFVCIRGEHHDGHKYAAEAIHHGALALVVDSVVNEIPADIPVIKVKSTRVALGEISSLFYGKPSEKMSLIGVTGTNGKTSVTCMLEHILWTAGHNVGAIGTLGERINAQQIDIDKTVPTTPEAPELQKLLAYMLERKVEFGVMEVTSIALDLERLRGCAFKLGIFTNISPDHLDYHQNMQNYINAKLKFFPMCQISIVNIDDPIADKVLALSAQSITYSLKDSQADIFADNITVDDTGTSFVLKFQNGSYPVTLQGLGLFNIYNALACIAAALHLGITIEQVLEGLVNMPTVPGRCETIKTDLGYSIIVDYAHSEDALRNVLTSLKDAKNGRLITVFGCGGNRDTSKRPLMGEVAGRLSDYCIITSDNPRYEDPSSIIDQIEAGLKLTNCKYTAIVDRRQAIIQAISMASQGDIILIAGKGHESYQEIAGIKHHFNDKEVIEHTLQERQPLMQNTDIS